MSSDQPPVRPGYEAASRPSTVDVPARVTVVDFDMSFWHLVFFFVKAAIAAIPAAIILAILGFLLFAVFAALIGMPMHTR